MPPVAAFPCGPLDANTEETMIVHSLQSAVKPLDFSAQEGPCCKESEPESLVAWLAW